MMPSGSPWASLRWPQAPVGMLAFSRLAIKPPAPQARRPDNPGRERRRRPSSPRAGRHGRPAGAAARRPGGGGRGAGGRPRPGCWWCSPPAGASRRCTGRPPRRCGPAGAGPTLVVSPLLALMRDQVAAAERAGLRAATINSTNVDEWDAVFDDARPATGSTCCWSSPERLNNPRFARPACRRCWPASGCSSSTRRTASPTGATTSGPTTGGSPRRCSPSAPGTPVLATTATANERVTADVAAPARRRARVTLARLAGPRLAAPGGGAGPQRRWSATPGWPTRCDTLPGSGIVYALTVAEAERLAGFLRRAGSTVAAYTAGSRPTAAREPSRTRCGATGSRPGRHLGAGHGLRQARPGVLRPPRLAGLAGGLLPAGRPRRPGAGRRRGGAAAGRDRRADLGVLRHRRHSRPRRTWTRSWRALARRAAVAGGARDGHRHPPRPARDAAQDPGRRRRGAARRPAAWAATGRPWYFDAQRWADAAQRARARGRPDAALRTRRRAA